MIFNIPIYDGGGSQITVSSLQVTSNGTYTAPSGTAYSPVQVSVTPTLQAKTNISPTTSSQTISADNGYDGLSSVQINAMPAMTLPTAAAASSSGTSKATISRSTSDQYINIPTGYNSAAAYYKINAVANGSAGTPTATKGAVSNHSVTVTPSVTNTTGYITGGTKTGTAVSVSASELVSGTLSILSNGTDIDVVDYATVDVAVPQEGAFIVTVSYNSQTEMWEPDCTYQDLYDAVSSGRDFVFQAEDGGLSYYITAGADMPGSNFQYSVYSAYAEHVWTYQFDSNGITPDGDWDAKQIYLQTLTKAYTPTESTQTETVTFDPNYYNGLQEVDVTINPISSTYVGSGITRRSSSDLTASGNTVSVPSGYYSSSASKSVSNGSATGPSSLSASSATVSTGTNTLTLTKTGVTTTPTVSAGYVSSATSSTATVALTASVTTKAAATYYATTSDQSIAANTYLTGAQTIKALSQTNLSAANIKAGTTISVSNGSSNVWSVAGTYTSDATATAGDINYGITAYVNGSKITGSQVVNNYYTGSSTPSSSLGSNGDIYLKVVS